MERERGFEPLVFSLPNCCSTVELLPYPELVARLGLEPRLGIEIPYATLHHLAYNFV